MLGEFGFGFYPSLGKAIVLNNIVAITKTYRERDRKMVWIQIDGSCYKIIDYSVLQEIKLICLKLWINIISPCSVIFKIYPCHGWRTAPKKTFPIKDLEVSCGFWAHLLKKSLMKNYSINETESKSKWVNKLNIVAWPFVRNDCFVVCIALLFPFLMPSLNLMMLQTKGTAYFFIVRK